MCRTGYLLHPQAWDYGEPVGLADLHRLRLPWHTDYLFFHASGLDLAIGWSPVGTKSKTPEDLGGAWPVGMGNHAVRTGETL